jgi:cell division control protein 6
LAYVEEFNIDIFVFPLSFSTQSPRELVFPTYKEDDIVAILEQRLGKHVVDHKALQLISRRVATSSGDARRALEITSNAVGKCIDQLKDEDLEAIVQYDDQRMPLVKLPHMMRAIREAMPMRHADVISGLPQSAKVILCIAVSLGQVWGPTAKISISTLKKYCVEATKHAIMDELGPGHVMSLVEMLMDSGLLIVDDNHHFNPNDANSKLKIGVQLDDVEIALEESLLREGCFYRSLVDYVKRECPRPSGSCV